MNNPQEFYNKQIVTYTAALQKVKKRLLISSVIRLCVFIGIIAGVYFGYPNTQWVIASIVLGVIAFIILVSRHSDLAYTRYKLEKLIQINQLEIDVDQGRYEGLDMGASYIDPTHPYSYDIDLFGDHSFFQYLNRTATQAGKDMLAYFLASNVITEIKEKQDIVQEMAAMPEWRQEFSAIAQLVQVNVSVVVIQKWLQAYIPFVPKIMKFLPHIISSVSGIAVVLLFLDIITFQVLLVWFFVGLMITGTQLKKINTLYSTSNQVKDTFEQYYKLIAQIENTTFTTPLLKEKQRQVCSDVEKASVILQQFARILNAFDQRNNMLFGVIANGLLLWDIRQSYRIEHWIATHRHKVNEWFEVIAFFDAYNSLGNFAFNKETYVYPELLTTASDTLLQATALGHPMLTVNKRVDNDILIQKEQFLIITGANMAGKSTFLRTVALQIVLSNIGLPICAASCRYSPMKLVTSMRTSDSLSDDASYFFSELTQLKKIVTMLAEDNYFIILDEILKGTNSKDKAAGSRKFVERLVGAKATGIIATHDLSLCEIATVLPQVENRFFDAQIIDDELYFDYTFKDGICQNMNASFLLQKMGIVE